MSENVVRVSIIIPTYNSEKYLRQCLDSAINQTLRDIEIIVVDSASIDSTISIVEEYMKKDTRIKLLKRGKEWVSASRNAALDIAKGEYIMFLDSDDWYSLSACEVAFRAIRARNTDILIYGDYRYKISGNFDLSNKTRYIINCKEQNKNVDMLQLQMFLWDKIYKKSFLDENNIRMPGSVKQAEDQIFNFTCEFYTDKYSYIDTPLVFYREMRPGGSLGDTNGILYDLEAFKFIYNTDIFKKQPIEKQLRILGRFLECQLWNRNKWNSPDLTENVNKHIGVFLDFAEEKYNKEQLATLWTYVELARIYQR